MIKRNIKRPIYLKKILPYIDKNVIKVIVGQRRVGKSFMMLQIIDEIKKKHGAKANIININKELHEFENLKNHTDLLAFIKKHSKQKLKNYIFVDEVQDIKDFEKALRSLQAEGRYDIYCTGSNANLLSGELATYLSGRHVEIPVYGLSYEEFLTFHKLSDNKDSLNKYLKFGGLPYLIHLELEETVVYDYLQNIYNTILYKDIISRNKIRHTAILENLIEYLAENTGSFVSAKKISDFLKSQKINISPNIIINYLKYLTRAYFIFKVQRSDVKGKKIFEINEKYYFEDLGLRHSIIGFKQTDINKILENVIYIHLKIRGYKVTIGQLGDKEIDFVAEKSGQKLYVQADYTITEDNREREFGNLLSIEDNYPKYVVSMDDIVEKSEYKGIKHFNIKSFLQNPEI